MPGMDGTGPRGLGPMTGGGRGWCNPYFGGAVPPFMAGNPYFRPYGYYGMGGGYTPYSPYGRIPYAPYVPFGWGRGMGRGLGRGMGRGWW